MSLAHTLLSHSLFILYLSSSTWYFSLSKWTQRNLIPNSTIPPRNCSPFNLDTRTRWRLFSIFHFQKLVQTYTWSIDVVLSEILGGSRQEGVVCEESWCSASPSSWQPSSVAALGLSCALIFELTCIYQILVCLRQEQLWLI